MVWAPIRRPDAQPSAAFPDLSATRTTRRARHNSHNPYPARTDELNLRASQWRKAGHARGVLDGPRADTFSRGDNDDCDTPHGAQMSSIIVHDRTAPGEGAWARMGSGNSIKGKGRAREEHLVYWMPSPAAIDISQLTEDTRKARAEAAAAAASARSSLPAPEFIHTKNVHEIVASPAHLALLWGYGDEAIDMIARVPSSFTALDASIGRVIDAKRHAQGLTPPHVLAGFSVPAPVPLAHWAAAAIHLASWEPDNALIERLAGALTSREWQSAAKIAGSHALRAALCFKNAIVPGEHISVALCDALQGYADGGVSPSHLYITHDPACIVAEYASWVHGSKSALFDYPFLLNMQAKAHIIAWEGYTARRHAERASWVSRCPSKIRAEEAERVPGAGSSGGAIHLGVRRSHIIHDSMALLDAEDLHVPLHVTFAGEDGQDVGGVRKEWLLLLCEALQDSSSRLFTHVPDEPLMYGQLWLADAGAVESAHLFGIALGLALFNQLTVPLHIAPVLYRLLLWHAHGAASPLSLDDLRLLKPALCHGLDAMLKHSGNNFEDTFQLTWSVSTPRGQVSLVPGGAERIVTAATRDSYIDKRIHYELVGAPGDALAAVCHGFARVVVPPGERSPLSLLSAAELEALVCGQTEPLDIAVLRASAVHVGYSSRSPARVLANIDEFWDVWATLAADDQRALLAYITGSPRVPALGAGALGLRVHHVDGPVLGAADALPTSSTCTSTLFLPTYTSRAVLESRIRIALMHSRGFGLA